MPVERIEKLLSHWRTVLFWDESRETDSILFCFDQCIFCSFQTQPGDVGSRRKQIIEHEKTHPRECEVGDFYRFRQALHSAAMVRCPYSGLDAFQWSDGEEWRLHFERFINTPENAGAKWGDCAQGLFATAKEWKLSAVALN